jgi:hypothetical protein
LRLASIISGSQAILAARGHFPIVGFKWTVLAPLPIFGPAAFCQVQPIITKAPTLSDMALQGLGSLGQGDRESIFDIEKTAGLCKD